MNLLRGILSFLAVFYLIAFSIPSQAGAGAIKEDKNSEQDLIGTRVYYQNTRGEHQVGKVLKTFENQMVEVKWISLDGEPANGKGVFNISLVSLEVASLKGFVQNQTVYFS